MNRLPPPTYPSTITGVQIYFRTRSDGLPLNTPLTVISATNPTGTSSISIFNTGTIDLTSSKISALDQFVTYPVPARTITSGDFLVGFIVQNPPNIYPADLDQLTPSQLRSYISGDGLTFYLRPIAGWKPRYPRCGHHREIRRDADVSLSSAESLIGLHGLEHTIQPAPRAEHSR